MKKTAKSWNSTLKRGTVELRRDRPSRQKKKGFTPASKAQREKVRGLACVVTQSDGLDTGWAIDPAHLTARAQGGCDDPLCVVPLRRDLHSQFDSGDLDLLPYLEPHFRSEIAHAVEHLGLVGAYRRLTGHRLENAA